MPLYATNGRVQDLPYDTQFLFWDNQLDWGRAYKIASIEQQLTWGTKYNIGLNEFYINLLLENILNDPCKTFISRPEFQEVDWKQWGAFCRWFFSRELLDTESLVREIRGGNCGYWLGQFLASYTKANADWCYIDTQKVDSIIYWGNQFQFNTINCNSISKLPDHWPTPEEIAQAEAISDWWVDLWGPGEVKRLAQPTNTQQLANQTSSQSPSVIEDSKELDKDKIVDNSANKKEIPWVPIIVVSGGVLLLATVIGYSMKKEEDFKL